MDARELKRMGVDEVMHSEFDQTTYVVRTDHGFAVCDNGEEIEVETAEQAVIEVLANAQAYADAHQA